MAWKRRTKSSLVVICGVLFGGMCYCLFMRQGMPTCETKQESSRVASTSPQATAGIPRQASTSVNAEEIAKGIADGTHPKTVRELLDAYGYWGDAAPLLPLLDIDASVLVEKLERRYLEGKEHLLINLPDFRGIGITPDLGVITGFGDEGEQLRIPRGWKTSPQVAPTALVDKARAVLRALNLPYEVSLKDLVFDYNLNSGFGGWLFHVTPEYQGVKGGGVFNLEFSAYSGKIISLANAPLKPPNSMTQSISEAHAINKASEVVSQDKTPYDTAGARAVLRIVYPSSTWGARVDPDKSGETRLAWRVLFGDVRDRQAWVDIDAATGEVIGGGSYM